MTSTLPAEVRNRVRSTFVPGTYARWTSKSSSTGRSSTRPPSAESTMPEKTGSLGIDGNGSQSIWPSRAISATVRPSPIAPYERRAT